MAAEAGHSVNRDDWRLEYTVVYLADSREEAMADIREGAMREIRGYTFKGGGTSLYEAYPGQPAEEITLEQIIDKRRWIVGDPDYCVQRIRELNKETGGFGGLLMLTIEWATPQKWYRSLELFARYVVPQFNGSLRGIESSYDRMVEDARQGRLPSSVSKTVTSDLAGRLQK
jgi:limonene 1,2-monooxygenase